MKGQCGVQMPTGITTTTTYNSLSTAMMWIHWLLNKDLTIVEAGKQLGFKVKYFPHNDLHQATFLKGWWISNGRGGVSWLPLPSAVIKLGKLLVCPTIITSFTRRGSKQRRPYKEAVERCAYALSNSYQHVPVTYPVFGKFLSVLRRLGIKSERTLWMLEESHKPLMTVCPFERVEVLRAMEMRYGISDSDVRAVENLLDQINTLPAYVEHPVFDMLVDADY